MRILFLFTLVTLISSDFLFSQEKSTIIQTINDRELKIYKGNSNINIFFEFCDASNLEDCYTSVIKFDLRGIVKLLEEKENELVNAKLQHSLNKLKKTHILKKIRKEIAVLLTKKTLQESEVR